MLTALTSPAERVRSRCFWNASTATVPSSANGNNAAAIPVILRRGCTSPSTCSMFISFRRFELLQTIRVRRVLVMRVQRITARRQSAARRSSAVAERPAHALALQRSTFNDVQQQRRIRQQHSAESDAVGPALAYRRLGHVRQKLL